MPSKILRSLNQLIRADLAPAEVNSVGQRGFCALSLQKLTGARAKIYGIAWSATASTPADRANLRLAIALQRNLIVTQDTAFPGAEDINQMIFQHIRDPADGLADTWTTSAPLILEPGESYCLFMSIAPLAAFVGNAILCMTVFGTIEAAVADDFGVNL